MKVLFITRKYPPQTGGMENLSYNLTTKINCLKKIIALRKKQIHLLWFFPYALIYSLLIAPRYDIVHLGDPLLSAIGFFIKFFYKKPVAVSIHGLDITYPNKIYQTYLKIFSFHFDKYICISKQTMAEAEKRGYKNLTIIPPGVNAEDVSLSLTKKQAQKKLEEIINNKLKDKSILLTVGRLVRRKGHVWFLKNVFPYLPQNCIYLIIGDGPEKEEIETILKKSSLKKRVFVLGKTTEEVKNIALSASDLFIMPNIKVRGDMEGFGIVALEAAAAGLAPVASNLEGISEAIQENKNGVLIPPEDPGKFKETIANLLKDEKKRKDFARKAKEFTIENYSWAKISEKYFNNFKLLIKPISH